MNRKKIYLFMGPPGAGKGTISSMCVERFGWTTLSTGNLCRKHIVEGTDIGKKIDFIIKSGKLVSDELISAMIKEELEQAFNNFETVILDGFPRKSSQVDLFWNLISGLGLDAEVALVSFEVPNEVVLDRLLNRLTCSNKNCQAVYSVGCDSLLPKELDKCDKCKSPLARRGDDDRSAIENRLREYGESSKALVAAHSAKGTKVVRVDASCGVENVFDLFKELMAQK